MDLQKILKVLLFTALFVLPTTQQKVKNARFVATKDAILQSSASKKLTAQSATSCAIECLQTDGCRSWNYFKTRNIENCELNSRKALNTDILVRHDGGLYYHDAEEEVDCNNVYGTGILPIKITGFGTKEVYCDNGWLVVMRRYDNTMNFNRNWNEYKLGFGDPRLQFWMGNEALHALTNQGDYSMLVDMLSCNGGYYYVKWNLFRIENEAMKYAVDALTVESYNTTKSISGKMRGRAFGTADNINVYSADSGKTCAEYHGGGWWFQTCTEFHLTGNYPNCTDVSNNDERKSKMKCMAITGYNCNIGCLLQAATMKLRRNN